MCKAIFACECKTLDKLDMILNISTHYIAHFYHTMSTEKQTISSQGDAVAS